VAFAYAVMAAGLFAASKLGASEHHAAHLGMHAAPAE
jgi:AGZA family xanthine/uracil permease-like MFS transporter